MPKLVATFWILPNHTDESDFYGCEKLGLLHPIYQSPENTSQRRTKLETAPLKTVFTKIKRKYSEVGFDGLVASANRYMLSRSQLLSRLFIPKLQSIAIEPTNACNLRCTICYSQRPTLCKPRKKGFMDWNLYIKIIDELSAMDLSLCLNLGGESLLHQRFLDMIDYASAKGRFDIGFNTNGTLLKPDIAKFIVKKGVSRVSISLDGLRAKHESIRVGSNYNVVVNNIMSLIEAKRSTKALKPFIAVNLTKSSHTQDDILDFIKYWIDIVDGVEIGEYISEDLTVNIDNQHSKGTVCLFPFYYLAILWNGDVTICCHDISGRGVIGNVCENSVMDTWKSRRYKALRMAAAHNVFEPTSICYKCNVWMCGGSTPHFIADNIIVSHHGLSTIYKRAK